MNEKIQKFTKLFGETYSNNLWGSSESRSGAGSQINYTENIKVNLERIITTYDIKLIFDCSCGDWNWMKHVDLSKIKYIGNDIVGSLVEENKKLYSSQNIEFSNLDCITALEKFDDKSIDLVLCRHTLEHLELDYCIEVCKQIKRVAKYSLITSNNEFSNYSNCEFNTDGYSSRQIDLQKEPFLSILGQPFERIYDTIGVKQTDVFNGINFYCF